MQECFNQDPNLRPSFEELLAKLNAIVPRAQTGESVSASSANLQSTTTTYEQSPPANQSNGSREYTAV